MKRSLRGIACAAVLFGIQVPAAAQDASALVGSWNGTIEEGGGTYWIELDIDLDRNGGPVASVAYEQPCNGVWTNPSRQGDSWRFEETITFGRERCAGLVAVTLTVNGDQLEVRLRPVEFDGEARGTLHRLTQDELDAAAEAVEDAAAAAEAAANWGTCGPNAVGLDAGQAKGEGWYVDNEPVQVAEGIFFKYGLPRVIGMGEVEPFANYNGAAVFVEAGSDDDPEVIHLLVGSGSDNGEACEFQPYRVE